MVVNVQGDLPTLDPADFRAALAPLADPAVDIATLAAEIAIRPSAPIPMSSRRSARRSARGRLRALSFTRADRPTARGRIYHHIGLYAYRRAALERFVKLPPSAKEQRERLEQLRALDAGMRIDVALVESVPLGVDTPEELAKARKMLAADSRRSEQNDPMSTGMAKKKIVFQGEPGANSHLACREAYPDHEPLPCPTFEDCFAAISSGDADLGMIPIENSVAGRVADIHHLMPTAKLHIIAEWFLPIRNQLMAPKGATLEGHQDGRKPHHGARPVPQDHPQARHQADGRGRHRGLRARRSPSAGTRPAPRSPRAWRRRSTASRF